MSKSNRVLFIVASILLIVSAYTIVRLITINHSLRQSLPYLLKNEAIDYFELVDEEGNHITREAINKPSFIFIFSRPCSPCDRNIALWNAFTELFREKMDMFGIVVDEPGATAYLREKVKLNFSLYSPEDIRQFISRFRLRLPHSQTIIVSEKGNVAYLKPGELTQDDFSRIVEKCEKY
jgi:peroxiredoxin